MPHSAAKRLQHILRQVAKDKIKLSAFSLSSSTQMPPLGGEGKDPMSHVSERHLHLLKVGALSLVFSPGITQETQS